MNLVEAFSLSVSKAPQKTAVYWGDDEVSYLTLFAQANQLRKVLVEEYGVGKGDRVALWVKNSPEFISAMQGVLWTGAVVVPVNCFLKPDEVRYILEDSGAKVVIIDETFADPATKLKEEMEDLGVWNIASFAKEPEPAIYGDAPCPAEESDLAALVYTSGTTGRPKGAMLSHGNFLHNVESCRVMLEVFDGDRFVLLLPMFHSFMLTVCNLLPLLIGGSVVLIRSVSPLKNALGEIIRNEATILPAAPQIFRALLHDSVPRELPLRLCISGSAPLPLETLNAFQEKFSFPLLEGYGLSESSPAACFNPLQGPWVAGSIGVPIPNVELSIRHEEGGELPAGETGEVCIRGGNVMQGYWQRPDETATAIRDGWLYTGDIGHKDENGYFYITDRKKDMLLVNGINVYPREIEEIIYQFNGIKETAVVGMKDSRKGEMPVAFVVGNPEAKIDVSALGVFLKEKLAAYKQPRKIVELEALPRNATGKILKTELRKQLEG